MKNRTTFEKNGVKYITTEDYHNKHTFEVVNKFPNGYVVWAIGVENSPAEGYLPLARPTNIPYNIDTHTLKTLFVGKELHEKLMKRVHKEQIDCLNFEDICKELQ